MKQLQFTSPISLKAKAGKPRKFAIHAYNGGLLNVDGFDLPVVVDLSGLKAFGSIPILLDHTASTETTIGQTSEIRNDRRTLKLSGPVTGKSQKVKDVLEAADDGYVWQASIGAAVETQERIPQGQRVTVNGQSFVGPVIVARQSTLRETSVLPVGADASTTVNLAAAAASKKGTATMPTFEEWLSTNGFDPSTLTPEATAFLQTIWEASDNGEEATPASAAALLNLRATHSGEHDRIRQINNICIKHPQIASAAITAGWSPIQTENAVLKANAKITTPSNRMHSNNGGGNEPNDAAVLCASFAMTAGGSASYLAKHYGEQVVDKATTLEARGASLRTVMDYVLRAAGNPLVCTRINDTYIRAAFKASQQLEASGMSTMSLPGILSNSANKLLLEGFEMIKPTWQEFCAEGNLADFKEAKRYRMVATGEFEELPPRGHIKHLALTNEETFANQLKTYAKMVSLDRTEIINDDLGAFEALPKSIGRLAITKLEKEVYKTLLGNAGSFFSVGNKNILSGGGSALSIDALTAAEALFKQRLDGNGDPILLEPSLLLVPSTLSNTAKQLVRDTQVVAVGVGDEASVTPGANPHGGSFVKLDTPWLENANLTNNSTAGWYLIAKPQGSAGLLEVGFLNGQKNPTIEEGELDFSQLGMSLRGYWDFGIAQQDGRYGVFNVGS